MTEIKFFKALEIAEARQLNPLSLAFVGDAVHTLFVRARLTSGSDSKANVLNRLAAKKVSAVAQAEFALRLEEAFTEEEREIFMRARNSKYYTGSKNASIAEYRKSSGIEAVFGFLYLSGQNERLIELLEMQD